MGLAADWFKPIYYHMRSEVFAYGYVQIEETPIRTSRTSMATPSSSGRWTRSARS